MKSLNENINQTISDFDGVKRGIEFHDVKVPYGTQTKDYEQLIKDIPSGEIEVVPQFEDEVYSQVSPTIATGEIMDSLIGEVTIEVLDREGNIIKKIKDNNAISHVYTRLVLLQLLSASGMIRLTDASNVNKGHYGNTALTNTGIYLMSETITIDKKRYMPPYVKDGTLNVLDDKVTFYNIDRNEAEIPKTLIPMPMKSFWNDDKTKLTFAFAKTDDSFGTIKSIIIGQGHETFGQNSIALSDNDFTKNIRNLPTSGDNSIDQALCVYEFKNNETIIYKSSVQSVTNNYYYKFNCNTKEYESVYIGTNAVVSLNIVFRSTMQTYTLLKVNNDLWDLKQSSATAGIYRITISKQNKWFLDRTNTVETIVCDIPNYLNKSVYPVMCYREDLHRIEIFMSINKTENGWTIYKISINPDTNEYEIINLGENKFNIGHFSAKPTGVAATVLPSNYYYGIFRDGKYYLPVRSYIDNGVELFITAGNGSSVTAYSYLGIFNESLTDFFGYHSTTSFSTSYSAQPLILNDELCTMNNYNNSDSVFYTYASQIVSQLNLTEPIVKNSEDIIAVSYSYKVNL